MVPRFLQRHPELANVHPYSIDLLIGSSYFARGRQLYLYPPTIATSLCRSVAITAPPAETVTCISLTPTYNMDESGFALGEKETERCIINTRIRRKFQAKPGRQEWVTVVGCVCADGSVVSPLVIFKAENFSIQWITAGIHDNWGFNCNSKGWTCDEHGLDALI